MKSPKQVLKSGGSLLGDAKPWIIIGFFAYILWTFRGWATGLADTGKAQIDAATAEAKANAEVKTTVTATKTQVEIDKARLTAIAPGASDADVIQYRIDAETICAALGTQGDKFFTRQRFLADADKAFSLLKQKYSRLLLSSNKPYDKNTYKIQNAETGTSAHRRVNYHVLDAIYKDVSGGRNLSADVHDACSAARFQPYLKWVL
jgi:hypothetical protein